MNNSENNKENKISVADYLNDKYDLEITYTPFDSKMLIVSHIMDGVIKAVGGLNTTLLRRVFIETLVETITNIDMKITDENDLQGFDQLLFHNKLDELISDLGIEYVEFKKILDERVQDYIRIETNPAVTITQIYNQVKDYMNIVLDYVSEHIQGIDVEHLARQLATAVNKGDDSVES